MSSPNKHPKIINSSTIQHISEQVLANGQSLNISQYIYKDHNGVQRTWEVAGRSLQQKNGSADCVATLAVLRRLLKYDCLILVKQYRPPLKQYTLEFPADFVDPSEVPEETAIRELREETGYYCGRVKHSSPLTAVDPGLSKCTVKVMTLEVNGDESVNSASRQSAKDADFIEVVHIPLHELLSRLNEFSDQGIMIDSRVYCFAVGLAVGAKNASHCSRQTANPY